MKRTNGRLWIAALLWSAVAVAACAHGDRGISRASIDRTRADHDTTIDRAACATKGGIVKPQGVGGFGFCAVPYPDAGQACSEKNDCAGNCIAPDGASKGQRAIGRCQATNAWEGCDATVDRGIVSETFCRD